MLFSNATYPKHQLPPTAAVYLEGFIEERKHADLDADTLEAQRAFALYSGSRDRVQAVMASDHCSQAAALLVNIEEMQWLIGGHYSIGGQLDLDREEVDCLRKVMESLEGLLRWHFENGAGELLPIAEYLGLVRGGGR